ncbi:MAG: hypothetical protein QNK11_09985 [Legionella sp.]|nr:hypothetical protein [Legionella sp.]
MPKHRRKKKNQAAAAAEEAVFENSWQFKEAKDYIKAGKTSELETLVGKNRSILNERGGKDAGTLLHYACSIWGLNIMKTKVSPAYLNRFHKNIAFLLNNNGSSLEIKNSNNDTPLMIIAKKNSSFKVQTQVEKNDEVIELFNEALQKIALKKTAEPGYSVLAYTRKDGSHTFETQKAEEISEQLDSIVAPNTSATISIYSATETSQFKAIQLSIKKLENAFGLTLKLNWLSGSEFSVEAEMPCATLFYTELEPQLIQDDGIRYHHNATQNLLTIAEHINSQTKEPLALLEKTLTQINVSFQVFEEEQAQKDTRTAGFNVSFSELAAGMKAEAGGNNVTFFSKAPSGDALSSSRMNSSFTS